MLTLNNSRRRGVRGFGLVELMVALVVGMIVIGAVLTLMLAIMKSDRQTLQSTRLNQQLRATMSVIANDLRRARGVTDPLTAAKDPDRYGKDIDFSQAGCVRYAYAEAPGGVCRMVMRATTGANADRIFLFASGLSSGKCAYLDPTYTCPTDGSGGVQLGSDQVAITELTFTPTSPATPAADTVRSFDVTITGHLIDDDDELESISRSVTQSVQIRSLGVGN